MIKSFSVARSMSGIYRELRTLRRMAESYFESAGIPLPQSPYERLKERLLGRSATGTEQEQVDQPPPVSEEELARLKVQQIVTDLSEGRDPGTEYRPWLTK